MADSGMAEVVSLFTGHVAMTTHWHGRNGHLWRSLYECPNMDMPKYGGEVVTWRMVTWRMMMPQRWFVDGTCCDDNTLTSVERTTSAQIWIPIWWWGGDVVDGDVTDGDMTDSDVAEVVCWRYMIHDILSWTLVRNNYYEDMVEKWWSLKSLHMRYVMSECVSSVMSVWCQ